MNIHNYLQTGKSVNVTASAGTGKTWFIIAKILRMLLDGVSPEKITAITFTRKASVEMRERLNEKMELWSQLTDEDIKRELNDIGINENIGTHSKNAKKLFINNQLNIKDIRISTFDAFFMEILSQFHLDTEIAKKIETNTNINSKLIAQEVEDKIFSNSYLESNEDLQKNIDFLVGQIGSFHSIKESINGIIDKKSYYLEIYKNIFDKAKNIDNKDKKINDYKKNFIEKITTVIKENNLEKIFSELNCSLSSCSLNYDEKIKLIINSFLTNTRTPRKNIENKIIKEKLSIEIFTNEIFEYEVKIFNEIQNSWKILVKKFFEEYQDILSKENLYDFSDKTWLCYKKLSEIDDDDWILYKISNSINHILIDEFQDTNYIQWQIIKIILNSMRDMADSSSVTIVGDPKQSIYGFRGSEPKLFELCKKFTNSNFNSEDIFLSESRRSSKDIVKFVNKVFPENKDFFTKIDNKGTVDISELNLEDYNKPSILQLVTEESYKISKQIHNILSNYSVNYKDIIILVRNKTHSKVMEEILIKESIPVTSSFRKSILENPEINDLYLLLKYLILGEKNINELYSLLISPIFNYTIEELNTCDVNKYNKLENFIYIHKLGAALPEWKKIVGLVPIHDLLNKIYYDIDIINIYYTNNEIRNSEINNNFLNFLNLALRTSNGRYITPFQFLHKIEKMRDFVESNESAPLDCVRILTIHSAKGLEAEAIILAQTYRSGGGKYDKILPVFSKDLSCKDLLYKPKIFKNNLIIDRYFKDSNTKDLSEDRNLLYVACTRAKQILIINGYDTKGSWFSNSLFFQ